MNDKQVVHYEDIKDRPGKPSLCGNTDRHSWVCGDSEQVTCEKCLAKLKEPKKEVK